MVNYSIFIDVKRCTGCQACSVACMDQNDLEVSQEYLTWRQVFNVENGQEPEAKVAYVSMSCMHCDDAPCLLACPTGAIKRDLTTDAVDVSQELCIGCRSCSLACPFGVPRFGLDGKMQKCNQCLIRVKNDLEPACVRTCPTRALKFGPVNQIEHEIEGKAAARLVRSLRHL
jgi:anaerobic dimethyl sulfoxide reductase subunit B (iron-sulfur subunit)